MSERWTALGEASTAIKFACVGLIGLAIDATLLRVGLVAGLSAWGARAISLFCAMQATFAINGLHVFRCLTRERFARQWAGYMVTQGCGNLCNYWIFLTLVSLHRGVVSNPYLALAMGAFIGWMINYAGVRLVVFGRVQVAAIAETRRRKRETVCGPQEAAAGLRPPPASSSPVT
ncbi:MAG: GtrA family protein [Caulobacteraceae bacterium]